MPDDYLRRVEGAAVQFARAGDVLVNEVASVRLADTQPDQTVSLHVATLRRDGSRFGCVFCRFLDFAVQRGHCEAVLTDAPLPWWVYPRAAFWFVAALGGPVWLAFRLLS